MLIMVGGGSATTKVVEYFPTFSLTSKPAFLYLWNVAAMGEFFKAESHLLCFSLQKMHHLQPMQALGSWADNIFMLQSVKNVLESCL